MHAQVRKSQCAIIARAMVECRSLSSVHLRRAGMWTDTLAALVPPQGWCDEARRVQIHGRHPAQEPSSHRHYPQLCLRTRDFCPFALAVCPNMKNIKLDSNSLAYLSAAYFNESIDSVSVGQIYIDLQHRVVAFVGISKSQSASNSQPCRRPPLPICSCFPASLASRRSTSATTSWIARRPSHWQRASRSTSCRS